GDVTAGSAVLHYQEVLEKGNRGESCGEEANGATAGDIDVQVMWTTGDNETGSPPAQAPRPVKYKVFKDLWGTPIAFVRFARPTEVQSGPYTKGGANLDPLDPLGKLRTSPWATSTNGQTAAALVLGTTSFPNQNFVPSAVS